MANERLFADTNLFLRLLTDDVPDQAEAFANLLRKAGRGEMRFVTNPMVLAEIVWTLESYYELSKEAIQEKILAILNTPGLEVTDGELILRAILCYAEYNVDFIDAYNAAWMFEHRIVTACTFDQKHFAQFEGIATLIPG
jgi:predicted nucleic acid-binding protein